MNKVVTLSVSIVLALVSGPVFAGGGKLLATPGTSSFEGGAGGGIVTWAVLSGYDTREQYSLSGFTTRVDVNDYTLDARGLSIGFKDRVAVNIARQDFKLRNSGATLRQHVYGAKLRLLGDVVYTAYPQISTGIYHKRLRDGEVAALVGATDTRMGNDIYVSATKLHLGLASGLNVLWNITARHTKANQTGFLGYGGDKRSNGRVYLEGSVAILFNRHLALGVDYREKPDNLSFAKEEAWRDVFVAWFPNKKMNLTFAWAELGSIANSDKQRGAYLSLTAYAR